MPINREVQITASTDLIWYTCYDKFFCAKLDVPLDYSKPDGTRIGVPMIKYPATSKPYKGMVLHNPGGPGAPGTEVLPDIVAYGEVEIGIGSNYDFVSWDPRGIGHSTPVANCSLSSNITGSKYPRRRSLDKLYGPTHKVADFDDQLPEIQQVGRECYDSIGDSNEAGVHMSTTTVVRDIVAELEDPHLLNFWGISYGTVIGQVFASMFPDRVGRMALDGVVDMDSWTTVGTAFNDTSLASTDDAFSVFFHYCHFAGPDQCEFYTGSTPHDIFLRFETLVLNLNATYATEQSWSNATNIDNLLKELTYELFMETYSAIYRFPNLDKILVHVEQFLPKLNASNLLELSSVLPLNVSQNAPESVWLLAVLCSEQKDKLQNVSLHDLGPQLQDLQAQSFLGGEGAFMTPIVCANWPIVSNDIYSGPFGGETKNPILFIGNTLDPITPHINAQKASQIFTSAQLLTIEGVGHSLGSTNNTCGFSKLKTFFQTGSLPEKTNYCPLEAGPWGIVLDGPLNKTEPLQLIYRPPYPVKPSNGSSSGNNTNQNVSRQDA
ncbi:Tripeptidyl aminopeptidase [Lachnellula suecica]|uniref:Tripeptidyl aminopeptidase n=1 Tax=Lachnellula suecica TaxID=602035 RepID=A0A8T9CDS1_9HELO|nr:Tripeptidyl aminopeptidase [Lachnellula suecica]